MRIHHNYLSYPIVFHSVYRVYDPYGMPGLVDSFLRFRYLNQAKRYVDAIILCLIDPKPEPEQSLRLAGFYTNNRDDGPLPRLLFPNIQFGPKPDACAHVEFDLKRNGWCLCSREPRKGSSRCYYHEFLPSVSLSDAEAAGRIKLQ